jgi:hypothetical protein
MTWKVTEGTKTGQDDRRDPFLVNVFETWAEAAAAVAELGKYTQGTDRQFTSRMQLKPRPNVRHWKGVTKAGVVDYYETWKLAKEALMNDRDLRITMEEGPSKSKLPKMPQPVSASDS